MTLPSPSLPAAAPAGWAISALAGWYGTSALLSRFGATDGDQTTGGQLSFGPSSSSNRALGLLATSTTGGTAFGVRFINGTAITLTRMNLQFTGEVWRQSNLPRPCSFIISLIHRHRWFSRQHECSSSDELECEFPDCWCDSGGVAVDGTSPLNQTNRSVLNQAITNWPRAPPCGWCGK